MDNKKVKYDFAVIGANGIQGKIVSRDLLESGYSVLLCANNDYGLDTLLEHNKSDFAFINLKELDKVKRVLKKSGAKVAVNCAINDFSKQTTEICLELGINYVDLGSSEEVTYAQMALNEKFREKNIAAIIGSGSTPGVTNVMLRHLKPKFDTIHTVHVGFAWKSNMKKFVTPFSIDVIAHEFALKAKIFENGKYVERWPQECQFQYNYKGIGKQTTWYTDHMEHFTFYEYLKDVGIKNIIVFSSFPDHARETILKLVELGFTKYNTPEKINSIEISGVAIEPIDFTEALLKRLPIPKGYEEKENLWLKVWGTKNKKEKFSEMDAVVKTLPGWEEHTCNIDTGIPASIMAQMIHNGTIQEYGVFSPEFIIPPEPFFAQLAKKKIWIYENDKKINKLPKLNISNIKFGLPIEYDTNIRKTRK